MIKVTKLDGTEYYLNPHQIESIEIRPDTVLVMLSGKTHIVREEADDVLERINAYRKRLGSFTSLVKSSSAELTASPAAANQKFESCQVQES